MESSEMRAMETQDLWQQLEYRLGALPMDLRGGLPQHLLVGQLHTCSQLVMELRRREAGSRAYPRTQLQLLPATQALGQWRNEE